MKHNRAGLVLLASVVVIATVLAGCTGVQDAASPEPTPPAGEDIPEAGGNDSVAAGNNRFAFDLYQELRNDPAYAEENLFFSPYSISSALAITYEGARGRTADEIRAVFHLPVDDTARREGFLAIDAGINSEDSGYTLRTANALWAEETYPFLQDYIETAGRYYSANVTNLDFTTQPEASRITINRWVEERTNDLIKDLLPEGSISPLTRLVITNAIYFKGTWVKQFDENKTVEAEFRKGPGESVLVPMMQRTDEEAVYGYAETNTLQVLEMPYTHESGTGLSMLVILPDEIEAAEESLDAQKIDDLRQSLTERRVNVYFPKFSLETTYPLAGTLAAMGMPTAFTDAADLSGMDGTQNLFVSRVVHKAFVDVNEEGTEAAAATGVIINLKTSLEGDETPTFRADHPFIFAILDNDTGTILFMGRVVDPVSP
ncbi:proteinase inhibitor I4 serpin [Methanofollis liminatans DSM 4140]|uniref:Proteinase inhibitor I4 serpin n=1 Tax=Methanofollis liminatans DSM 4140 TaxID=28892 RepID=J0S7W7_9EURY|nr:serpin family protein [Methanofollis liminatans]EJG06649.1 proteinase inhibitor I4 serpin [Methanofollis liminatans DSM 4140]